jgi:hypothetical protein
MVYDEPVFFHVFPLMHIFSSVSWYGQKNFRRDAYAGMRIASYRHAYALSVLLRCCISPFVPSFHHRLAAGCVSGVETSIPFVRVLFR